MRIPHISSRDTMIFIRNLSVYLRSGIPLLEALDLARSESARGMIKILPTIYEKVSSGVPLSSALSLFPNVFAPLYIHLISAGEVSGSLPSSLSRASRMIEKKIEIRQQIIAAALYPLIILTGVFVVSFVLLFFAFPKILPLLVGMHVSLPLSTRVVLGISTTLRDHVFLCVGVVAVAVIGGMRLWRITSVRANVQNHSLRIPVVNTAIQHYVLSLQFRTLTTLLQSGMRITVAIPHLKQSSGFIPYTDSLTAIEDALYTGNTYSSAMKSFPRMYPPLSVQLVLAGERTGTLVQSLDMLAEIYEQSFTERIKAMSSLIEPALLLILGLVVGTIALSIISPMYSITQQLNTY